MAAFIFTQPAAVPYLRSAASVATLGMLGVVIAPLVVVAVALLASLVGRLRRQRALLDELFEQAPKAVALMSADYRIVRVNREFTRLFGYGQEETVGRDLGELIVPEESRGEAQTNIDTLARGLRVEAEGVRQRKDGSRLHVSIVHVPVSLAGGRIARYAVYRDVTERKRAEESLKLFRSLIDQSSDAIEVIDANTLRFLDCNRSAHQTLGYSREEFLSLDVRDIDPTIDAARFSQINEEMERAGSATFESLHRRKDGSLFPVEVNAQVVRHERDYRLAVVRDITERKRAEEGLRRAEEKYRGIFENAVEGIFQTTPDGQFITANPALARMLGYDSPAELLGNRTDIARQHYVDPGRRAEFKRLLERHGVVREFEHQAYRRDGGKIWLSENVRVVRDERGAVLYYEGFTEDITERKRAEDALKESEESHRIIAETASDAIITIDEESAILFANSAAEQVFGYTPEEVLGRRLTMLMPEYLRHLHTQGMRRYVETGKKHILWEAVELTGLHKSGREIPLELSFGEFTRDGKHVFTGIARDITERRRAEEQLKQSERQLAEAQRLAHIGSWNWDLLTNTLTWSDELYRIFGVDPLTFEPADETLMESIHAGDRALVRGVIESSIKTQEPFSFHYRVLRPGGEERVIHSRGEVVSDDSGNSIRMFGTAQDVTERRQAEERLRATTEQMRALSARIRSAKEEEGTRIAREIHDELGAALTSLRWELESFDKVISEAGGEPQIQALRERIGAMLGLTEATIGSVRRISSELRPSVLDDLGLAEAIEWQAQQFQARTGIACRCDCFPGELHLSREQSTAVFRIFQEALTNIGRHARATCVDVSTKAEAGEFVLKIVDNGRGITENERSGARSLGLLGMQERARLVGGRIDINGVENEGTVITVRIPIRG